MTNLQLLPGVHIFRRQDGKVQLGINPRTALVLPESVLTPLAQIANVPGHRPASPSDIVDQELDSTQQSALSNLLLQHRLARDIQKSPDGLKDIDFRMRNNLLRDLAHDSTSLERRLSTAIHIYGGGRLGTSIAVLLAASGFPHIRVIDASKVQESDVISWGASRLDIGLRRDQCAALLIERTHRGAYLRQNYPDARVPHSLAIFAPDQVADGPWFNPDLTQKSMSAGVPHLVVGATSHDGWLSHVIESGRTACLRCQYYSLCDLDPCWKDINHQLSLRPPIETASSALMLHMAIQVVSTIDFWFSGSQTCPGWNQWSWPDLNFSHSAWPVHPMCGCAWN